MSGAWDTATTIAASVAGGRTRATDVIDAALARIATVDNEAECVHHGDRGAGARAGGAVDAVVAAGGKPGPLAGVPFAVKNLIDVAGLPTLAGSKINRDHAACRGRRPAGAAAGGRRRDPGRCAEHGRIRL